MNGKININFPEFRDDKRKHLCISIHIEYEDLTFDAKWSDEDATILWCKIKWAT